MRYKLFKDCYLHKVARAIDHMVVDCLYEANPVFKFNENLNNPDKYMTYTDNILPLIENSSNPAL